VAFAECVREQDVVDAVTAGRWPGVEAELRGHVRSCRSCADLVEVLGPLLDAGDAAWQNARVPSSGVVWWRAQMRARREATVSANRPLTIAQVAGTLAGIAVLLGIAVVVAPWFDLSLAGSLESLRLNLEPVTLAGLPTLARHWWIALLVGSWLLLAPMAIYFAVADD
jgi:hypothetical protein